MRALEFSGWAFAALTAAMMLAPLLARSGAKPPFGRPWYVGNGLGLLAAGLALLFASRRLGWRGSTGRARRRLAVISLLLASYLAFVSNYTVLTSGDNLPQRALPLALATGDGFDLSRVVPADLRDHYAFLRRDGRLLSAYPIGTGVLLVPYYGAVLAASEVAPERLFVSLRLEKHAAALLACASVALLFVGTRRWLRFPDRLLAAASLAFATQWLPTVGQALWSTTGAAFFATAALALAAAPRSRWLAPAGSGAAVALQLLARPNAVSLLPLSLAAAPSRGALALRFAAATAVSIVAIATLNLVVYGSPVGGFESIARSVLARETEPFARRLAGVLASPSRGLLWHFPVLLLAAPLALRATRSPRTRRIAWAAMASVGGSVLVNALWPAWWGGHSLGPRLLAEVSLPVALLGALAWATTERRTLRALLAALLICQAALGFGLVRSEAAHRWNAEALAGSPPHGALWSLRQSQWLAALCPPCARTPTEDYLRPGDGRARRALDLAAAANAPAVEPDLERRGRSIHLPRLAAAPPVERDATGYRFLPAGPRAAVRVCGGESSAPVELPGSRIRQLRTVILWSASERLPADTQVGELLLVAADGGRTALPLRVDRELSASDPARRGRPLQPGRLVGGLPDDPDALVEQRFRLPPGARGAREIRLRSTRPGSSDCLYWLAASVETARRLPTR